MRQLYIIGSLVAILLIVLFGLTKLGGPESGGIATNNEDASQEIPMEENFTYDPDATYSRAIFKTNKGDITIDLYTEDMPITTGNFIKLAGTDFYDGIKFHRVIEGFMIQAGDPLTKDETAANRWGQGGPGYTIEDEFVEGRTNVRGTIAMANTGAPNSGGSQFFINLVDNTNLDFDKFPPQSKHPVFGEVVAGMEVVDAIGAVETMPGDRPVEPVIIRDIVLE